LIGTGFIKNGKIGDHNRRYSRIIVKAVGIKNIVSVGPPKSTSPLDDLSATVSYETFSLKSIRQAIIFKLTRSEFKFGDTVRSTYPDIAVVISTKPSDVITGESVLHIIAGKLWRKGSK